MTSKTVLGQKSFGIASDHVEAWVTEKGGQMGPVSFNFEGRTVLPFSVAPWAEDVPDIEPILQVLRGDFFCVPFGSNDEPFGDEKHTIHGETANRAWEVVAHTDRSISMTLQTSIRPGTVDKQVWVEPGQSVIYQRHTLRDMTGPMCLGHHAMLRFDSPGLVSVSPFSFGQVFPGEFENPAQGGYSSLRRGARFERLDQVPFADGTFADLTKYPAREGFEDLAMVYSEPNTNFAWSAVTFPDEEYIWFSLKDPRILSGTVMWHSNGGRHYAPWSGRHRRVLALEEVTSYMHYGLAGSVAANDANRAGFRTFHNLTPGSPLTVNSIIGVVSCGRDAGAVGQIACTPNGVRIKAENSPEIDVQLCIDELYSK